MAAFNLKNWLGENRELVISKYNDLTNERFYDGVTLKVFMLEVMNLMSQFKSAKMCANTLPTMIGNVYFEHSRVFAEDKVTDALREKHEGTAYMALV